MQFHQLQPNHPRKRRKRVGRGGKRGTYSGRGIKGQKARAGAKIRPAIRDLIKKIPKLRGRGKHPFTSLKKKPIPVNLRELERAFGAREEVTVATLLKKGFYTKMLGRVSKVKILGEGELSKPLIIRGIPVSKSAKEKIEKAGGRVYVEEN
ncbi:uL15 family ribosomal protein [Candidatus Azambacteria bacterium]|nr:uL15 family ribosomal protein [Candidatus Azambacteria bacterium]MBI2587773.1 uL15 family ribosomal protein [Candidatus Azambacteria bacterium]